MDLMLLLAANSASRKSKLVCRFNQNCADAPRKKRSSLNAVSGVNARVPFKIPVMRFAGTCRAVASVIPEIAGSQSALTPTVEATAAPQSFSLSAAKKREALEGLKADRLRELVRSMDVGVENYKNRDALISALADGRRVDFRALLAELSRDELKALCLARGFSPAGKEKGALIERLLREAAPTRKRAGREIRAEWFGGRAERHSRCGIGASPKQTEPGSSHTARSETARSLSGQSNKYLAVECQSDWAAQLTRRSLNREFHPCGGISSGPYRARL